jgi:hypothetical protein
VINAKRSGIAVTCFIAVAHLPAINYAIATVFFFAHRANQRIIACHLHSRRRFPSSTASLAPFDTSGNNPDNVNWGCVHATLPTLERRQIRSASLGNSATEVFGYQHTGHIYNSLMRCLYRVTFFFFGAHGMTRKLVRLIWRMSPFEFMLTFRG